MHQCRTLETGTFSRLVLRWDGCQLPPNLCHSPKRDTKHCLTNSKHRHIGAKMSVLWSLKYARIRRRPSRWLGRWYHSLYPPHLTPLAPWFSRLRRSTLRPLHLLGPSHCSQILYFRTASKRFQATTKAVSANSWVSQFVWRWVPRRRIMQQMCFSTFRRRCLAGESIVNWWERNCWIVQVCG